MKNQSPFLDIASFVMEVPLEVLETSAPLNAPFLPLYESEDGGGLFDPETEDYVAFLNELYDEEFDQALSGLVSEAVALYETGFMQEQGDAEADGIQVERFLTQHLAPLASELELMLDTLATEFGQSDANTLTEAEIDEIVDRYQPTAQLTPAFEDLFGSLKKAFKKVAKKAVSVAKKGVAAVATGGLSLVFKKLRPLIKPLLKRVVQFAIGKLPPYLRPIARKLARRHPLLREVEEELGVASEAAEMSEVALIQHEFNQQVASLLFASNEVEMDLELAQILSEEEAPDTYPLAELERAREQFVEHLLQLEEGEEPNVEEFIPAILPALRIGIRLAGRKRVVNFLAKLVSRLIQRFVGRRYARPLSRAIVDVGLRLLRLEVTEDEAARATASAVAATVEDTVRRVAAAPEHVLDDQELLEGFILEAFEQAAAANLPPGLSEEVYRMRPDLAKARKLGGIWMRIPHGRRRLRKYKKFSRPIAKRIAPHEVAALETFDGIPLGEVLEAQLGIAPGQEVEALVHLYEAVPGTWLPEIARQDESIASVSAAQGYRPLHPLSREAAGLLLGDPELGREFDSRQPLDAHSALPGQRFYYLEIPGRRPLTIPGPSGRTRVRRPTQVRVILDFPKNEIRLYLFLSEVRAQEIAVKLRQRGHIGLVVTRLRRILERGMRPALAGAYGRLKIVHETVTPDQWTAALRRLPALVPQSLRGRVTEWAISGLSDHLKQRSEVFIQAAEDSADGVTLVLTLGNPPGFPQLRQALKGKGVPLASLKLSDGTPTVKIRTVAGYVHE